MNITEFELQASELAHKDTRLRAIRQLEKAANFHTTWAILMVGLAIVGLVYSAGLFSGIPLGIGAFFMAMRQQKISFMMIGLYMESRDQIEREAS